MKIRLGRKVDGSDLHLDLTDSSHTLLTGRTRSGKSVALYIALFELRDKPVHLAGIDPTGILFNAVGDQALGGNKLRASTLRHPDRALFVVNELVRIMDDRIEQLLAQRRDKFEEFTPDFPLIIALFEEYPSMLAAIEGLDKASGAKPADRLETKIRAGIQRLALEGAKVGIRLWIVAQRGDASILTGVMRSQLSNRLSFAQDETGLRMLHESISSEQIEQASRFLPGQAFAEIPGTESKPLIYRSDLLTYQQLTTVFSVPVNRS